ncbi:branched-chain amino acid aminotransferase [Haemophilus paracuniculus]|uniref:Branched-chain amino acid aminotransferase n=1 Tax=Haemophilus paracuniculus TaxID=734 RepID=A0A1T0AQC5_9PAST|nr:aminotransferase class IV family protein [Haemophilus paracuniculus]OOR98149.1 branched-chain amino acid aminotransferase [Haemophilus paracuniculus]
MCQFPLFETILIENGEAKNLYYHQQRVEFAFQNFFKHPCSLNLAETIIVPEHFKQGIIRCRIDYNERTYEVNFYPYQRKLIQKFQCVYTQNLDYQFKYSDRKGLDLLKNPNADEVIIINNGFVSDCTIGNLLFLKENQWYSSQHYLLKGTQLTQLVEKGEAILTEMRAEDLPTFEKVMMINALNPFDLTRALPISSIEFCDPDRKI